LLYCHTLAVQEQALEALVKAVQDKQIPEAVIDANYQMVQRIKKETFAGLKQVSKDEMLKVVGHPEHVTLSKQIARKEIPAGLTT
jgi:predicted kinase